MKSMENLDDNISSTGFQPLFIKEEDMDPDVTLMEQREHNTVQSGLTFTGTQMNKTALMKPYLQEMDELLKSCEELTGIPLGSHFSASYDETSLTESIYRHSNEEDAMESYGETSTTHQAYLSPSYIDTHMDGAATEDHPAQGQSQGQCTIINRCGTTTGIARQTEMPLTSAGTKLSETMVEYEGQLLGMLAMLESSMEEAGMDFEPQDWATDASQEYVHISTNLNLCRGTTLVPIQQGTPMMLDGQSLQFETLANHSEWTDGISREIRDEASVGSATNGSQQNPDLSCDYMGGSSMEKLKSQGSLKTEQGFFYPQFRFSEPLMPLECTENYPTKTGSLSNNEGKNTKGNTPGIEVDSTELPAEQRQMETIDLGSGVNELSALGPKMEECIAEVQQLQVRRKELLAEMLELRGNKYKEVAEGGNEEKEETEQQIDSKVAELMDTLNKEEAGRREERKRELRSLREERAEEERRMWKLNVERQGMQDDLRKLKRRLFTVARECAQNQVALKNQHREVDMLRSEEEKLQSLVLQLTEEGSQIRLAHQQQLSALEAEQHAQSSSLTSNTQDDLTEYRRHSCGDIQQYMQGGLKSLEDRYEPLLLTLLKRRDVTAEALVKAKEHAQELRAQLRPLKEEIQKLKLQRACLEEKLKLIHIHKREDVGQYKETVYWMEESSRALKTELEIQKRKTKEIKELRESLTKQLLIYRAAIEDHKCDDEKKT